jgi:anaphase-promoting complex subunit 11
MSKFQINRINMLSSWSHNLPTNKDCSICRCNLNTSSMMNQEKGIDSYVVQGTCNHSFHYECIKEWVGNDVNKPCPICFNQWAYKDKS